MRCSRSFLVGPLVVGSLVWLAPPVLTQRASATPGQAKPSAPVSRERPAEAIPGPDVVWTLAAAGDAIMNRRLTPFDNEADPRFQDMVKVVKSADAGFLNLEESLFRLSEFKGWGEVENGGNWEVGPPEIALDLKAIGFTMFNRANNHTTDYGVEGMRVTDKWLDDVGIVHAGTGPNLGQASRPGYLDTPKGRIALIGIATTFTPMSRAGAARPDIQGRPGLNALRIDRKFQADAATFQTLKGLASTFAPGGAGRASDSPDAPVRLFGATIERGAENHVVESLNKSDEGRILREVRNASRLADFVLVSSHSHEPGNDSLVPPPWMVTFAREVLDAGATAFLIHGPHQLRGVEIYKGRPIFYSMGNFVFHNETIEPMPSDNYEAYGLPDTALASELYDARFKNGTTGFPASGVWYQSVIALPTFKGTQLTELKLHPIDLQWKAPRSQRGTPRLATGAVAKEVIDRMTRMSAALGTLLANENGVLVWRAPGSKTSQ